MPSEFSWLACSKTDDSRGKKKSQSVQLNAGEQTTSDHRYQNIYRTNDLIYTTHMWWKKRIYQLIRMRLCKNEINMVISNASEEIHKASNWIISHSMARIWIMRFHRWGPAHLLTPAICTTKNTNLWTIISTYCNTHTHTSNRNMLVTFF